MTDKILGVLPRYPPSTRSFEGPLVVSCNACAFCVHVVTGTSYTLNPTHETGCVVETEPATWSILKRLFR